ncbi:MAG TPA: nitronate monooxygenase [Pseudolabrys sp.]|nr:nitronate monooxygenase [Pseudolabrys sp.]
MTTLRTRLTDRLGIEHPVVSAPMGFVAGGRLAAAVTQAGGLGLIGGGYGDAEWLEREFAAAGNTQVGCGFITWSLAKQPHLLDRVMTRAPAAIMLSFGPPAPFAQAVKSGGALLVCQIQKIADLPEAIAAGADIIVAQGTEAGGHSQTRTTFTLVPEVADYLAKAAPDVLLLAAGGVADGRGLAAALMLGADGVLVGSRLLMSEEAIVPAGFHDAVRRADGDATVKTRVLDIVRGFQWPPGITGRALRNRFVADWQDREAELSDAATAARELKRYTQARDSGDADNTGIFIGEIAGLLRDVRPAAEIVRSIVSEADLLLAGRHSR